MAGQLTYEQANPLQRFMRRFAASGPGPGARSGVPRSVPVLGLPTPDGLVVIASNYGQERHPAWYHNLRANPDGHVTVDGVSRAFHATVAEGDARARIWQEGLKVYPGWSQYERRAANRRIGVFVLSTP